MLFGVFSRVKKAISLALLILLFFCLMSRIDYVVNASLYNYGLRFSYDWARGYWATYSAIFVVFAVMMSYVYWLGSVKTRRDAKISISILVTIVLLMVGGLQDIMFFVFWAGGLPPTNVVWWWSPWTSLVGTWNSMIQISFMALMSCTSIFTCFLAVDGERNRNLVMRVLTCGTRAPAFMHSFPRILHVEKRGSEVTGTCYSEAQAPSGNIGSIQEIEFDKQVSRRKEKLAEMSENIYPELAGLVAIERNLVQIGSSEKTLKERYLEAVSCGWKTVKEVCLQVHPEVNESSHEKARVMKSTSMFLMRLSKPNVNLVDRRLGKTGFEYCLSVKGLKTLLFYGKEAARTERKRILHERTLELGMCESKVCAKRTRLIR
jgi:hypothetical protein